MTTYMLGDFDGLDVRGVVAHMDDGAPYNEPAREQWLSGCVAEVRRILVASYESEGYEGSAFVLYEGTDGKLYEVNSSHCSCNGLEWNPEETTAEALIERMNKSHFGTDYGCGETRKNTFRDELRLALAEIGGAP